MSLERLHLGKASHFEGAPCRVKDCVHCKAEAEAEPKSPNSWKLWEHWKQCNAESLQAMSPEELLRVLRTKRKIIKQLKKEQELPFETRVERDENGNIKTICFIDSESF